MSARFVVENIIILVCFTILAIVFKHWWIALFSIVLYNYPVNKKGDKDEDKES